MSSSFYRAFEDKHRGSRGLIKGRLEVYLPFVLPLKNVYPNTPVLDIGCGRGEWLELLRENNISAKGIDYDEGMIKACKALDLNVRKGEGIAYLKKQPKESSVAVSAFHVVEHISFEELRVLVGEAVRVLKPGGLLILETPNPENIKVATENFYLDPTHSKPIPSALLSFLPEFYNYERTKVIKLQEDKSLGGRININLLDVIGGVSPDYAVVAQKKAGKKVLRQFDDIFMRDFGLPLTELATKFEGRLQEMEIKKKQIEKQIHQAAEQAEQLTTVREQKAATDAIKDQLQQTVQILEHQAAEQAEQLTTVREQKAANDAINDQLQQTMQILEQQLGTQACKLKQLMVETKEQQEQANAHAQWLQNEWDTAREKVDELNNSSHHWWQEADRLNKELKTVYRSKSWLVTWPLRKLMQFLKWLFSFPINFILWVVRLPKRSMRYVVVKFLAYALTHPNFKRRIVARFKNHPQVYTKLRQLAVAHSLITTPFVPMTTKLAPSLSDSNTPNSTVDMLNMTANAKHIHSKLKAGIAQCKNKGV